MIERTLGIVVICLLCIVNPLPHAPSNRLLDGNVTEKFDMGAHVKQIEHDVLWASYDEDGGYKITIHLNETPQIHLDKVKVKFSGTHQASWSYAFEQVTVVMYGSRLFDAFGLRRYDFSAKSYGINCSECVIQVWKPCYACKKIELKFQRPNQNYLDMIEECDLNNEYEADKMKACFELTHASFFWRTREGVTDDDMDEREWKVFESREADDPYLHVGTPSNATDPYRGVLIVRDRPPCCDIGLACKDYRGTKNYEEIRFDPCRRWDHPGNEFNPTTHPEAGLDSNFCRNPDGGDRTWCYTEAGMRAKCSVGMCDTKRGEWEGYMEEDVWGTICDDMGAAYVTGNQSAWRQNDDSLATTACATINMIYPVEGGWDQRARVINEYGRADAELVNRTMNWANVHCNGTKGTVFECDHVRGVTSRKDQSVPEFCQPEEELGVDCLPGMKREFAPPPPTTRPPPTLETPPPTGAANVTMIPTWGNGTTSNETWIGNVTGTGNVTWLTSVP